MNKMQVWAIYNPYKEPTAILQSLKTVWHYKTLNLKCLIKRSNSVQILVMMHMLYRQADEPEIWIQCAKWLSVFYGKTFNGKLCALGLLAYTKYASSIRCILNLAFNISVLLYYYLVKTTGGQWRKALFCPPGGNSCKGVISCENYE